MIAPSQYPPEAALLRLSLCACCNHQDFGYSIIDRPYLLKPPGGCRAIMSDSPQSSRNRDPKNKRHADNSTNLIIEGVQTLGLSIILALGIRTFVAEARYIPSGSMEPTLEINDRLVVEKISYHFNPPQRGDIIVFWPPAELFAEGQRRDAFIKRVMGTPGDTIEVTDGTVYVNGQPLAEDYIKEKPAYEWGPVTVPPESYVVFGDNRNSSFDSHEWARVDAPEFVAQKDIIGKAVVRFWPLGRLGGLN